MSLTRVPQQPTRCLESDKTCPKIIFPLTSGAQSIDDLGAIRKSRCPPWKIGAGGGDCTDQSEQSIDSSKL